MINKKVLWIVPLFVLVVALSFVSAWDIVYYNPNSTIVDEWGSTGSPSHSQIVDSARQPNDVPNTNTFVDSRLNDDYTSEFGFPEIEEEYIANITLWVYASTGNTAEFSFYLKQGSVDICDGFVPGNSANGWFSCTWDNPSGDLSDLRIHLGMIQRATGGGVTSGFVYAAYLEVDTGPLPPVVTLLSPEVDDVILSSPGELDFKVVDGYYSNIDNCSLYGNFSGSWVEVETIFDVDNDTTTSFNVSEDDGYYSWNVLCENEFGRSSFADSNFTFFMNTEPPAFNNDALNETVINQGESIRFNVSITDYFGIDSASVTIKYPNDSESTFSLSNSGDEYYYVFSDTQSAGIYEVVNVWANDTKGKSASFNPALSFEVKAVVPGAFNLVSPSNNTESRNVSPLFSWQETSSTNFDNYTLYVSLNSDLSNPVFVESTFSVSETEKTLSSNLEPDETYFWAVNAFNTFGNTVNSPVFRYVTDNTPPLVSLNTAHLSLSNTSFNTFLFTPSDANTLDYCELFTNSSGSWISVNTTSSVSNDLQNSLSTLLVEGFNSWNVRCFDEAGNNASASNNRTLIVDLTPPRIDLISPVDEIGTNIVTFSYFVNDSLSGVESCSLIVNESVVETSYDINNKEINTFQRFLSNNYYSWRVSCKDNVGWVNSSDTWFLTVEAIDIDPPVVSLISPSNNEYLNSSTVLFEYLVEGVSEISNCSLIIDDEINATNFDVPRFESVFFEVNNFVENSFEWRVQCYDSTAEPQKGESNNRTFFVDLTNPFVTLNSPFDNVWLKASSVNFDFFVFDSNLDSCALYTNETGVFEERQTLTEPSNDDNNTIVKSMNNGVFVWNIFCYDLSNRQGSGSENFVVKVDTVAPWYENVNATPETPSVYSLNQVHNFSASWFDNLALESVIFEHNFSGSFVEEVPFVSGDDYWFSSELDAGVYSFRWFANDSAGNENSTGFISYTVSKDYADIRLYLNSSEDNLTIDENNFVNITAEVLKPLGGNISLFVNNQVISSGSGSLFVNQWFGNPGVYNVSIEFNETKNFFRTVKNLTVTVLDVTPPFVSLVSPSNDSTQPTGLLALSYQVQDFSDINYCALYVNDGFEENDTSIIKDTTINFLFDAEEAEYTWRVECRDSYGNLGLSDTWTFESINIEEMNVNITTALNEYEQGESIQVNISVEDIFNNTLVADVDAGVILGETSVPWWNPAWLKRKNIVMNETNSENVIDGVAELNITNIDISSCDELRIIRHFGSDAEEVLFLVNSSGTDWCDVLLEVNLGSDETNNDYFVYYNNSGAGAPSESLSLFDGVLFNAQTAASDEGTVQNVENIVGKNDDTFGRMTRTSGGAIISGHGRDFINFVPQGTVNKVEVRYRYAVPANEQLTWEMRYSVEGGAYVNAFADTIITTQVTSPWHDITNAYSSLTWTNLNTTRLQGRMNKGGGGQTATVDLYWVEMNVTYEKDILVSDTGVLDEEVLVFNVSGSTNSQGRFDFSWNTQNVNPDNYSIFAWASRVNFNNAHNYALITLTPDITPPVVNLTSPLNDSLVEKGIVSFVYNASDNNLDRCTLYLGQEELIANVTDFDVVSGENSFNVSLDYNDYLWNVRCYDKEENDAFSDNNFSFVVFVPAPVLSTELFDNETLRVSWVELGDASYYNIYISEDYDEGFSGVPNYSISEDNYDFNVSEYDKLFVKVTAVSNSRESEVGSFAGVYSHALQKGFNMVSIPFYLDDYVLYDGESGLKFNTDNECLLALWKYDSSTGTFESADWVDGKFVPSYGSEGFDELDPLLGHFVETSASCTLKVGGVVPVSAEAISLNEGQNLVPWLSASEKSLPTSVDNPLIITEPEVSVIAIHYFNNSKTDFDTSISYHEVDYGWHPVMNLIPMRAYYFESSSASTWTHNP